MICSQTAMIGQNFIDYLHEENCLKDILNYLYKGLGKLNSSRNDQIIPIQWLEAKIQNMRRIAIESSKSLSLEKEDKKVKLINKKELLFIRTDPSTNQISTRNAYLVAGVNLHLINPDTVFSYSESKDVLVESSNRNS